VVGGGGGGGCERGRFLESQLKKYRRLKPVRGEKEGLSTAHRHAVAVGREAPAGRKNNGKGEEERGGRITISLTKERGIGTPRPRSPKQGTERVLGIEQVVRGDEKSTQYAFARTRRWGGEAGRVSVWGGAGKLSTCQSSAERVGRQQLSVRKLFGGRRNEGLRDERRS